VTSLAVHASVAIFADGDFFGPDQQMIDPLPGRNTPQQHKAELFLKRTESLSSPSAKL
jgi:hypothetical protein